MTTNDSLVPLIIWSISITLICWREEQLHVYISPQDRQTWRQLVFICLLKLEFVLKMAAFAKQACINAV